MIDINKAINTYYMRFLMALAKRENTKPIVDEMDAMLSSLVIDRPIEDFGVHRND